MRSVPCFSLQSTSLQDFPTYATPPKASATSGSVPFGTTREIQFSPNRFLSQPKHIEIEDILPL